jgi:hypothetical protein
VKFKNPGPGVHAGPYTIDDVDTLNRTYTLWLDSDETIVVEGVTEDEIEDAD